MLVLARNDERELGTNKLYVLIPECKFLVDCFTLIDDIFTLFLPLSEIEEKLSLL